MRERVQKILARAGVASRRKSEELIAAGRVTVNKAIIKLGDSADASVDDIRVDGQKIRLEQTAYFALNKPRGVVSTAFDPHGRQTVLDYVPSKVRVYPVGRLDRAAEGLILLTNDGAVANRLLHPRYETEKTYHVTLARNFDRRDLEKLRRGVRVGGRIVQIHKVKMHTPEHVEITLHEGRKHIVKRLFRKLGYTVARLKRTQIGNITLGQLPSGACRELTRAEVLGLRRLLVDQVQERARPAQRS
jgi:23S rRNA pseudouridine2605 synthase